MVDSFEDDRNEVVEAFTDALRRGGQLGNRALDLPSRPEIKTIN